MRILALVTCYFLSGCYVLSQGLTQNSLLNQRKSITEVLADPSTDQGRKERLLFVRSVLAYAAEQGFNTKRAYEYFVDLDQDAVSYIVYAAEPLELKSKEWWFPIVGQVPYLGFFAESDRDEEAAKLRDEGFDVIIGRVGAFSSLGWFEDPIYSSMLRRNFGSLAHLLFHELTHRSFWSMGSVRFNENLAEYVASVVTPMFLRQHFGAAANEHLAKYENNREDKKLYKVWLGRLKADLDKLYASPLSNEAKLKEKRAVFARYLEVGFPSFRSAGYKALKTKDWNNARVISSSLYSPDLSIFEKAHRCSGGDKISAFFEKLADAEDEADSAFEALELVCTETYRHE